MQKPGEAALVDPIYDLWPATPGVMAPSAALGKIVLMPVSWVQVRYSNSPLIGCNRALV